MSPVALNGHSVYGHTNNVKRPRTDGFGTRAIHVGSDPSSETGAVIPAISLSTTYKQNGVGNHKVCDVLFNHIKGKCAGVGLGAS
jgi:cystathionine gamma-lyase